MSDKMLDTVAKLLAQAASTTHAGEAEAMSDKALELAARFGIDLAVARDHQANRNKREMPEQRKIIVGAKSERSGRGLPNNKFFVWLASAAARANDVKCNISNRSDYVVCFGLPSDIDVVQALFTGLAGDMVAQCQRRIKEGAHKAQGMTAARYKASFYLGYVERVQKRLRAARREAIQAEQQRETIAGESTGVELVLVRKQDEVKSFYESNSKAKGSWRGGYLTESQAYEGWGARRHGTEAGDAARLTGAHALDGPRTAVGG